MCSLLLPPCSSSRNPGSSTKYSLRPLVSSVRLERPNSCCQSEGGALPPRGWAAALDKAHSASAARTVRGFMRSPFRGKSPEELRHHRGGLVAVLQVGPRARAVVAQERRARLEPADAQVEPQAAHAEEPAHADPETHRSAHLLAVEPPRLVHERG